MFELDHDSTPIIVQYVHAARAQLLYFGQIFFTAELHVPIKVPSLPLKYIINIDKFRHISIHVYTCTWYVHVHGIYPVHVHGTCIFIHSFSFHNKIISYFCSNLNIQFLQSSRC